MVTDSWLSRTRVTVQSQARRWIEVEEIGRENSISPAAAPAKPFRVSMLAVTWRLARPARRGQLDQGVGVALRQPAVIVRA